MSMPNPGQNYGQPQNYQTVDQEVAKSAKPVWFAAVAFTVCSVLGSLLGFATPKLDPNAPLAHLQSPAGMIAAFISLGGSIAAIVAYVLTNMWLGKMAELGQRRGQGVDGGALLWLGWLIPFANVILPFLKVKKIYQGVAGANAGTGALSRWWGAWTGYWILSWVFAMVSSQVPGISKVLTFVCSLVLVVALLMWKKLIDAFVAAAAAPAVGGPVNPQWGGGAPAPQQQYGQPVQGGPEWGTPPSLAPQPQPQQPQAPAPGQWGQPQQPPAPQWGAPAPQQPGQQPPPAPGQWGQPQPPAPGQ